MITGLYGKEEGKLTAVGTCPPSTEFIYEHSVCSWFCGFIGNEIDADGNMESKDNTIFEKSIMDWVEKLNSNFTFHFFIWQYFKG